MLLTDGEGDAEQAPDRQAAEVTDPRDVWDEVIDDELERGDDQQNFERRAQRFGSAPLQLHPDHSEADAEQTQHAAGRANAQLGVGLDRADMRSA